MHDGTLEKQVTDFVVLFKKVFFSCVYNYNCTFLPCFYLFYPDQFTALK